MTAEAVDWSRFAKVFNDTKAYPTAYDVAAELGISYQTVRNRSAILRARHKKEPAVYPEIINRGATTKVKRDEKTPEQHAQARAVELASDITTLVTASKYPVINPEAIVVESFMTMKYDRETGGKVPRESTPRTWISDTLRVKPIKRCANRTFIFTGAQNDTEIHPIWDNLKAYAEYLDADLVVGPGTYETQWWSENNPTSRAYATELSDHLCFGQMAIGDDFVFCGEMNILPTASTPISDLVTYSRGRWAVFPHAKRQLKTVPSTDPERQAHQVMTTGLCTKPKVIPRKAGIKSIFHYVAGATIVEFDADGDIFCRQITAGRDGSFYDLDVRVAGGKVINRKLNETFARAITLPDVHERKLTPKNAAVLFGLDITTRKPVLGNNVIDDLRPQEVFIHDLFDNEARNHHNVGDNAYTYELAFGNRDGVLDEGKGSASFLVALRRKFMKINVVESNHDLALERYVREGRYPQDGKNIRLGLQLENEYLGYRERLREALDAFKKPPKFSVLEYLLRQLEPVRLAEVNWIYDGCSYLVDGVECGHHGFRGSNGAKGTVKGFARLGRKMSIGDKHTPEIDEGVFVAGVAVLQHGYNKGPSGWCVTLILQYPDGKRTLITLQNGKYRARRQGAKKNK